MLTLACGLREDNSVFICHILTFLITKQKILTLKNKKRLSYSKIIIDWNSVNLQYCVKNWKSAFGKKIFFKARKCFPKILISIKSVIIKLTIIKKYMQWIQRYRPSASVGIKIKIFKAFFLALFIWQMGSGFAQRRRGFPPSSGWPRRRCLFPPGVRALYLLLEFSRNAK